jgi:hypothetical protein
MSGRVVLKPGATKAGVYARSSFCPMLGDGKTPQGQQRRGVDFPT